MFIAIYNDLTEMIVSNICNQLNNEGIPITMYTVEENPYKQEFTSLPVFFATKSDQPGYYLYGSYPYHVVKAWAQSI